MKELVDKIKSLILEEIKHIEELEPVEKTNIPNNVKPPRNTGWVCPKCGNVYSPEIPQCWNCMNKNIRID